MAQNWEIDPTSKDYVMSGGSPVETDSLKIPAYFRLKVRRRTWLYAPNDRYGSDFHLIKKRPTGKDTGKIENLAANALQPIADDGRAAEMSVETKQTSRHGIGLEVKILEQNGRIDQLNIPGLGV